MITILVIGAFQAIFFALLLIIKRGRTLCDTVLAMWLSILFLHLSLIYCKYLGLFTDYPHLIGITSSFIFLYGPMLYFYIDNYISNFPGFKKEYFIHLILFMVYNIYRIPFYTASADLKLAYLNDGPAETSGLSVLFDIAKIISIPFYVALILYLLRKHRNNLKYYFSNFEKRHLDWVKYLIWSIAVIGIVVIFTGVAQLGSGTILTDNSEKYVLTATSVWIFGLGFYAVRQTSIFQNVTYEISPAVAQKSENKSAVLEYKRNRLRKFEEENFRSKLITFLDQEKPYLKNKLTIDELASQVEVSVHDLSLFINEVLDQNFFDLVNSYRVKEFKMRISDPRNKNYTLLGIALDSGFNSKASLNRIFKKHTGISPSQYLKDHSSSSG